MYDKGWTKVTFPDVPPAERVSGRSGPLDPKGNGSLKQLSK